MKEEKEIKTRLEVLRREIKKERISYSELIELQSYTKHIDKGDVELLQWAGVEEGLHMEYLGNCIDSFDVDGNCVNPYLPFADVSEFGCAVEEDDNITYKGIIIQYDEEKDIHSFFR